MGCIILKKLDEQEKKILKELVVDPRLSDNKVSQRSGIPVKTVNRKRKKLEKNNIVSYMTCINNSEEGTGSFGSTAQFTVQLKYGVTRSAFFDGLMRAGFSGLDIKHIRSAYIAEQGGRVAFILILESRAQEDLLEIFNSEIVPKLHLAAGHDCIMNTEIHYIHKEIISNHNYLPHINMMHGKIKPDWPKDNIFVG